MATIVLPANKVIEAATKTIARIMAVREERDAEAITKAIALNKKFSFRKGFYDMTKEEAIKWICEQGALSSWGFSRYTWGDLDSAKKLLKLAQHGDPVTLNEDDVNILF